MSQQVIDTRFLSNQEDGYIVSLRDEARRIPTGAGDWYLTAQGHSLSHIFSRNAPSEPPSRIGVRSVGLPIVLGEAHDISKGPDITSGSILIKQKGGWDIALPSVLGSFLPLALASARDLLSIYGAKNFKDASMQLIAQRTDINPGDAHRPAFEGWHDHMTGNFGTPPPDLIYSFADTRSTEFRLNDRQRSAADGSLVRFGAEVTHRSPVNNTKTSLRRTWGGIIVTPFESPRAYADNNVLDDRMPPKLRKRFMKNASVFLENDAPRLVESIPTPIFHG
jgi:hypothetical protein